jgi:hypothetical protein
MRRLRISVGAIVLLLGLPAASGPSVPPVAVVPLARAHAHNDYLHPRPLLDALDAGFTSVEADVWLVGGDLLVAHERWEARPGRTLRTLYLDPLRRIARRRGGRVYPGYPGPFVLLVDVKSEAEATYRTLHEQLRAYEAMLTVTARGEVRPGPVLVIVSGNRPEELMFGQTVRYAGYDGRPADLRGPLPASFMPLISDHWMRRFSWMGLGPMPDEERRQLREIVAAAHARRQRVRFWATPDAGPAAEAVWLELLRAGVDLLNTDRLDALRQFLLHADPRPSVPPLR